MGVIKKFLIVCCLIIGATVINGCSEVSTSFEHKSSVEVSTSSGVNYSTSYSETKSTNGLFIYKLNDVNLLDGRTEFHISITNNGKRDTTLNELTIAFKATDLKGNLIREGSTHFDNLSISLPQGQEVYERFAIDDPEYKRFDDSFDINCEVKNVSINPLVD